VATSLAGSLAATPARVRPPRLRPKMAGPTWRCPSGPIGWPVADTLTARADLLAHRIRTAVNLHIAQSA